MEISRKVFDELKEITLKNKPYEAAAILFKDNTKIVEMFPMSRSSAHFSSIDPVEISRLIDENGIPSSLFHSHPCSATPSWTDLKFMSPTIAIWGSPWLIMSNTMNLRCWTLTKPNVAKEIGVKII